MNVSESWAPNQIQQVWEKGHLTPNNDPRVWRKDDCGAWIKRDFYGKKSEFSWEIDHIKPKSKDGSDEIANLRPPQSQNNASRQAGTGDCAVTSNNSHNARINSS